LEIQSEKKGVRKSVMEKKPVGGLKSTTNNSPSPPAAEHSRYYKNNNKKQTNKNICCPFACPNCQLLGGEWVKSRYEVVNILSDNSNSIFSPMHEQYHDDYEDDHRSRIRNSGQVFLSADLIIDSFFQQKKFKK